MRNVIIAVIVLGAGFLILLVSVLRTASVKYENIANVAPVVNEVVDSKVNYDLAYTGSVLPGTLLWGVKALRDRVWILITTNDSREAELLLLFADKRIGASEVLIANGDIENAMGSLTKAEKYLEESLQKGNENRAKGIKTDEFFTRLANSSLKHYEILEKLEKQVPQELRPIIRQSMKYPQYAYEQSRNHLLEDGKTVPQNPFDWQ